MFVRRCSGVEKLCLTGDGDRGMLDALSFSASRPDLKLFVGVAGPGVLANSLDSGRLSILGPKGEGFNGDPGLDIGFDSSLSAYGEFAPDGVESALAR